MRHSIVNLGCKVNRVEADGFDTLLRSGGSTLVDAPDADLIVVNTCTVTGDAEKKTRKAVRRALRENGYARVVVTGCAAAIDAGVFEAMDERVRVVPKAAMDGFLRALSEEETEATEEDMLDARIQPFPSDRRRVGVKVQDGCDNACAYCIVHVARGPARSRRADAIVAEARRLAEHGVREIVLTGINLGAYRADSDTLPTLLERLLGETAGIHEEGMEPCRFRLSSIEPSDIDDSLIELMACAAGRICRHLHLPLQAGSSKVLAEMARPYTAEEYLDLVQRARKALPSLALSTDVIVGFPGETESEFEETLALATACGFSQMHVFPYSRRAGTPAAARSDQVPPDEKAVRAARLRDLAKQLKRRDEASRAGTVELALVESCGRAMTESYHEVTVGADAPVGELVSYRFDVVHRTDGNAVRYAVPGRFQP